MPRVAEKLPEVRRKANYQDVLNAPPNMVAQIIHGELYLHARPADPHAVASLELVHEIKLRISRYAEGDGDGDGPGEWRFMIEPELRLGEDVLVPDIAGWRLSKYPRNRANSYSEVVPNWVCEVLSPSTRERDLGKKSDIYAREGVSHLWIVDPKVRTLQASALSAGKWVAISTMVGAETVSVPPFEKLKIQLSQLWIDGPEWRYSG